MTGRSGRDDTNAQLAAYRHDAHKLVGEPHEHASESFRGIPVNEQVPQAADADAAALSRPSGHPEQTVANHTAQYRLSLLTGLSRRESLPDASRDLTVAIEGLLRETDPETMHQAWLNTTLASAFNESVYYPYTSLKYHTLLVAALLYCYREGHEFADLQLVVDPQDRVRPHQTVYTGTRFTLSIAPAAEDQPNARLGATPRRSWATAWSRLDAHPLAVATNRSDMVLDANLRRLRSWSTALQYLEDVERERNRRRRQ